MTPITPTSVRVRAPVARRPATLLYLALSFIAALSISYQARADRDIIPDMINPHHAVQVPFLVDVWPPKVRLLRPEAEAAGMKKGELVVSVAGHPISSVRVWGMFESMNAGDRISVVLGTGNAQRTIYIVLRPKDRDLSFATNFGIDLMVGIVLPWLCILLGLYVSFARPRDPLAWLLLGLLIAFSQVVVADTDKWGDWIRVPANTFHTFCFTAWPLFFFLFGYFFPETHSVDRRLPWLKWVVVVPFILMAGPYVYCSVGIQENLQVFGPLYNSLGLIKNAVGIYTLLLIGGGMTLIGSKASKATSDSRRRLNLLLAGFVTSLTPLLVLVLVSLALKQTMDNAPLWLVIPVLALLLLFPLTLAYVIVVDGAMDVRVAVRQGLQYAFARRGVAVLRVLSLSVFAIAGYLIEQRIRGNLFQLAGLIAVLLMIIVAINVSMKRLAIWVDKRFFRDAYNAEAVLSALSEQVRTIRETRPLVETVCEQISDTMHVKQIAVILESNGRFETSYSRGLEGVPLACFAKTAGVISYLNLAKDAPRVYFDDENSWMYRTPGMDDEERHQLANLGAELLLPLSTRDKLLGFIAAGQKRSEEPYSKADVLSFVLWPHRQGWPSKTRN